MTTAGNNSPEPEFVRPHPLATLACVGGLGYALPAIAFRPDLLPPPEFALGVGEFMLILAEDYRYCICPGSCAIPASLDCL